MYSDEFFTQQLKNYACKATYRYIILIVFILQFPKLSSIDREVSPDLPCLIVSCMEPALAYTIEHNVDLHYDFGVVFSTSHQKLSPEWCCPSVRW